MISLTDTASTIVVKTVNSRSRIKFKASVGGTYKVKYGAKKRNWSKNRSVIPYATKIGAATSKYRMSLNVSAIGEDKSVQLVSCATARSKTDSG